MKQLLIIYPQLSKFPWEMLQQSSTAVCPAVEDCWYAELAAVCFSSLNHWNVSLVIVSG